MNLSEPFLLNRPPQIVPVPEFPVPIVSQLAWALSYAMFRQSELVRGFDHVHVDFKSVWTAIWYVQKKVIAIYISNLPNSKERYLFLNEPKDKNLLPRKSLFDRFNALLKHGELPTLHEVVKDYWIFSDGVPWTGRRTLQLPKKLAKEKVILHNILTSRPRGY